MSEPMPESGGGAPGGFMSRRFMGIPAIVWLAGAAILAYLYFRNKNSSGNTSGGASSGSTGDTSTTGNISLKPSTETIDITGLQQNPNTTETETDQQTTNVTGPVETGRPPVKQHQTKTSNVKYTVKAGETLAEIARRYGISVACLAHHNVYVKGEVPGNRKVGERLGTGAGLKTGQVLTIPSKAECGG